MNYKGEKVYATYECVKHKNIKKKKPYVPLKPLHINHF